jgi:hypothetical protein
MKHSTTRILTTHTGSLPRPDDLIEANARREAGTVDEAAASEAAGQPDLERVVELLVSWRLPDPELASRGCSGARPACRQPQDLA